MELFAKSHITLLNKRLEWLAGIKGRMESEATSDPMLQPAVDFLRRVLSKIELHKQRVLESRTKRMNVYSNSDNFMVYPPQDQEKQAKKSKPEPTGASATTDPLHLDQLRKLLREPQTEALEALIQFFAPSDKASAHTTTPRANVQDLLKQEQRCRETFEESYGIFMRGTYLAEQSADPQRDNSIDLMRKCDLGIKKF